MIKLKIVSSLSKILPKRSCDAENITSISGLKGEYVSFQVAFSSDLSNVYTFEIVKDSNVELQGYFVKNVPVGFATFDSTLSDANYISHEPGLYPDLLMPIDRNWVHINDIYQSIWIRAKADVGSHEIKFVFRDALGEVVTESGITVNIIEAELPEQELRFTQWIHLDCIYTYYQYTPFSEQHWEMIEKFLTIANENGINTVLTPIFTPPLDTAKGTERPTVQLIDIYKSGYKFNFDFSKLKRWISLCKKIGFKYFEMPHLFTQWGAEATPKIVAVENGETKRIFGWDYKATSPEYDNFLSQLLPALRKVLIDEGIIDNTYFHISDEPKKEQLDSYSNAYKTAKRHLKGLKIIDAVSDFEFYSNSIIEIPVPATDSIEPFLNADIKERWCYYCCTQNIDVSNRFVAMPSSRNRSIGVQLFKFNIDGFLHWGFNFYYSQYSKLALNPFYETDAYGAFPSGDSFAVYPEKTGPVPAISLFVFYEALQDIRTLKLLEKYIGHNRTVEFIEEQLGGEISFKRCFSEDKILKMRQAVNEKLSQLSKKI